MIIMINSRSIDSKVITNKKEQKARYTLTNSKELLRLANTIMSIFVKPYLHH
jgi:hypothetical protein